MTTKTAPNRSLALWNSGIGKKVVMAVTGAGGRRQHGENPDPMSLFTGGCDYG